MRDRTERVCWLCGRNGTAEPLDRHHIFGGANRKKSEKYGLTAWLCHGSCHIFGERAAHRCAETRGALQEYGQRLAMERQGWTREEFARQFGKNYLDEGPSRTAGTPENGGGFRTLDMELSVSW